MGIRHLCRRAGGGGGSCSESLVVDVLSFISRSRVENILDMNDLPAPFDSKSFLVVRRCVKMDWDPCRLHACITELSPNFPRCPLSEVVAEEDGGRSGGGGGGGVHVRRRANISSCTLCGI